MIARRHLHQSRWHGEMKCFLVITHDSASKKFITNNPIQTMLTTSISTVLVAMAHVMKSPPNNLDVELVACQFQPSPYG